MPEGDTLYRSARTLHKALAGKTVIAFETAYAQLAAVDDQQPVTGRTVLKVESRGKWLLAFFSDDLILATHMRMKGSWHIYRPGERWREQRSSFRIRIAVEDFDAIAFNVPVAEFLTTASLERHTFIPKLGPDILSSAYNADVGTQQLAHRAQTRPEEEIANVLLNQGVLAGIGNVYKSEVCFAARVHPFRRMKTITPDEMVQMADVAQRYMRANIGEAAGEGIVTYTGLRRTTHSDRREDRTWVYGRKGEQCRCCGDIIQMRRQGPGLRSTYWCPSCQPWLESGSSAQS